MKLEFFATKQDGKLVYPAMTGVQATAKYEDGAKLRITFEEVEDFKTLPQIRFMHGPVLDWYQAEQRAAGNPMSKAAAKTHMKQHVIMIYDTALDAEGKPVPILKSMSKYTKKEMTQAIESMQVWGLDFASVPMPDPEEHFVEGYGKV